MASLLYVYSTIIAYFLIIHLSYTFIGSSHHIITMNLETFFRNPQNVTSFRNTLSACQSDFKLMRALFLPVERQKTFVIHCTYPFTYFLYLLSFPRPSLTLALLQNSSNSVYRFFLSNKDFQTPAAEIALDVLLETVMDMFILLSILYL